MPIPFLTPIIVTAGTTFVGSFFQNKNDQLKRDRQKRQTILEMATKTYKDLSKMLDTLYYTLMDEAIYIAIREARGKQHEPQDSEGWNTYETSLTAWKSNRNHLISEVEVYYGEENSGLLRKIDGYIGVGEKLVRATYYKTGSCLWTYNNEGTDNEKYYNAKTTFRNALKPLRGDIQRLNAQIVQLLQSHQVGDLRNMS